MIITIESILVSDDFTIYGCTPQNITLICENGGLINVTHAYFGQYATQSTDCPQPNLNEDCFELIEENNPKEWAEIKRSCDNKTQCTYRNHYGTLNACYDPPDADFTLFYYQCFLGE